MTAPPSLPNNEKLATAQLQHLKRKLMSDKQYHEQHTVFVEETTRKGDAESAPAAAEGETGTFLTMECSIQRSQAN